MTKIGHTLLISVTFPSIFNCRIELCLACDFSSLKKQEDICSPCSSHFCLDLTTVPSAFILYMSSNLLCNSVHFNLSSSDKFSSGTLERDVISEITSSFKIRLDLARQLPYFLKYLQISYLRSSQLIPNIPSLGLCSSKG